MNDSVCRLTLDDLRQALLQKVRFRDIEQTVVRQARLPSAEQAAASSLFLAQRTAPEYTALLTRWMAGSTPTRLRRTVNLEVSALVPFPLWGVAVPEFIKRFLKPSKKNIIALDGALSEIGAALCYSLSLYYCLQIPVNVVATDINGTETQYRFYPGDFLPELALYCLRHSIPLLPLNTPPRLVVSEMQFVYNQLMHKAQADFIQEIPAARTRTELQAAAAAQVQKVFATGLQFTLEREDLITQSCYCVSRLGDLAEFVSEQGSRSVSVAVLYKMANSLDVPDLIQAFRKSASGIAELYQQPEPQHDGTFTLTPLAVPPETETRLTPSAHAEKMRLLVERYLTSRMEEHLTLEHVDHLAARVAEVLRSHPAVQRPPGVRGTLAVREIAQAFGLMKKAITRADLARAAVLGLTHRTRFRDTDDHDPAAILKSVISSVIYALPLDTREQEALPSRRRALTADEAAQALQGLTDAALRTLAPGEAMPVDDPAFAAEAMNHPLVQQALQDAYNQRVFDNPQEALKDLLQELEDRGHVELTDERHRTLTPQGTSTLKDRLEQALARGELTPEQLAEALKHARSMPAPQGLTGDKLRLSPQAEAELLAELMDYQHQDRSSSSSLEDLYVHYAVHEHKGMKVLSDKVDYEKLKIMLHQLEKKGLLALSGDGKRYHLSHRALTKLLDTLIQREKGQILEQRAFKKEHEIDKTDVRRYRRGDVFRDISIRHSMRRILRKGKSCEDINYTDLRSFEKKPAHQLDIAVCVDISESMKHSGKLRYAKLAVAELARAAIEKNDRVGIVAFSNLGEVVVPLTDKITPLMQAAMTLRAQQYTNIGNGLRCARRMLLKEKNSNSRYIIVITDGQPNAALSDEFEDTASYHARVAAFSRQTSMETKRALGARHALVEAGLTRRQHIKISVVYIAAGDKEDEESERIAREIARIGNGRFHKVTAVERLPLEALEAVG